VFKNEYLQKEQCSQERHGLVKRHFWTLACDQFSELLLSANKLIDQSPNAHVMPKVNDTFVNGLTDNEKHDTMNFKGELLSVFSFIRFIFKFLM
jgi:hypothetical protein